MAARVLQIVPGMLAGLLLGSMLGAARVALGPAYLNSTARTLSQSFFERGVVAPPGAPFHLSDLVIHPPDAKGGYWITGRYRAETQEADFKFRAATPYQPRLAITGRDPGGLTVREYLDQIAARVPQARLSCRYAWYEAPAALFLLWAAGASVIGGGIAPFLSRGKHEGQSLWGLARGFPARRSTPAALPSIIETGPAVDPLPASASAESTKSSEAASTVRSLDTAPMEGTVAAPSPKKAYAGDFYPTEAHSVRNPSDT